MQAISILSDGQVYLPQGDKGLRIGNGLLVWDDDNNAIKVISYDGSSAANFYATGAVSALGANTSGSGGGGSSTLAGLTDVSVGSQTPGQVLGWDGQNHWVPMDMPSVSNYVTLSTNQTITGQKTFYAALTSTGGITLSDGAGLQINETISNVNKSLILSADSIGFFGGNGLILSVNSNSRLNDGTGVFAYTSEIPSVSGYATETWVGNNYLPLTGGTLSGSLTVGDTQYTRIQSDRIKFGIVSSGQEIMGLSLQMYSNTADTENAGKRLNVGSEIIAYLSDITSGGAVDSVCGYTGDVTAADIGSALQGEGYELTDSNTARLRVGNVNDKTICTTENTDATIQFTGGTDGFTVTDGRKTFTVPVTTTGTTYSQGTGISISGTTISMSSTYRTYCSNGNTAYGWGNHANAGYIKVSSGTASIDGIIRTIYSGGGSVSGTVTGRFLVYPSVPYGIILRSYNTGISSIQAQREASDSDKFTLSLQPNGGGVNIGSNGATSYALNVNGNAAASSFVNTSDVRKKDIYDYNALVAVDTIASAPAVRFRWKESEDKKLHCGSLAQYWDTVMPECVTHDNQGYLSMQYDVIALLAAISIAKKVVNHEERIAELERENIALRNEINNLKAA